MEAEAEDEKGKGKRKQPPSPPHPSSSSSLMLSPPFVTSLLSSTTTVHGCTPIAAVCLPPQLDLPATTYTTGKGGIVMEKSTTTIQPVVPFVFLKEVIDAMVVSCSAVFAIPVYQLPWLMEPLCRPRHWDRLFNTRALPAKMRLVDINIPDSDEQTTQSQTFTTLHQPRTAAAQRKTEVEFWRFMERSGDPSTAAVWAWDLKDLEMEFMDVWGKSIAEPRSEAYKVDKGVVRHYLNPNRFSHHPDSLFSVMSQWHWRGVTSPSYYLKTALSIYRMHFEQGFFPAFNFCVSGASVWYFVRDVHLPAVNRLLVQVLKQRFPLEQYQALTDDELTAMPMILYSRSLWLSPALLIQHGIPVERLVQTAGQVVVTDGCTLHWGMVADADDPHCVQEACNFAIVQWLTRGLRRLAQWTQLLHSYLHAVETSTNPAFCHFIGSPAVQVLIAHHAPSNMMPALLTKLKHELQSPTATLQQLATLSAPTKEVIIADIDKVQEMYKSKRVKLMFKQYLAADTGQ